MTNKIQFINRATDALTELAQLRERVTALSKVFIDRGYAANGTDPIIDADMVGSESKMTAAQLHASLVPTLADYLSFCNNVALSAKDRAADMSKARKDI